MRSNSHLTLVTIIIKLLQSSHSSVIISRIICTHYLIIDP
jgi:hypothetical protein